MLSCNSDYFLAQAATEDRLAATSNHRGVRARHERFAAEFRASAVSASNVAGLTFGRESATQAVGHHRR